MDRRSVLIGLGAALLSPRGEAQKATSGPRSPAEGPGAGFWEDDPGELRVALRDAQGRTLAEKLVPFRRDLVTVWPVWLLPAAVSLHVTDGAYEAGWPLEILGVARGVFTFRTSCRWLMWPRREAGPFPWWGKGPGGGG